MKNLWAAALLIISHISFSQSNTFTISGKIKGLDSKKMHLAIRDESATGGFRRDSILIINESFTYTGSINDFTLIGISPGMESVMKRTGRGYYPVKSSLLQFFAFPGAKIKVSGKITDFVDAYPSGDAANNELTKLNKAIYPLMNKGVNLSLKIANKVVKDSIMIKRMNDTIKTLDDEVVALKQNFIAKNTSSAAAIWQLSDMMVRSQLSNEVAANLFSKMNKEKLVNNPYYTEVAKRVDAMSVTAVGKMVPEINSLNTYDGKNFELASLKGKYVVLDFWGTWCGPCIAGMPRMKEYLEKYKTRMEIVGVAQESDNGDRWRKFLNDKPEYRWHHVLSRANENYILKFGVAGFPTKIIVDPEGKIVGRYVGEDDAIYKKLDELFANG